MDTTGRFDLPLIMPSQAQKHVTHNEALTLVDGLMHVAITSFGGTAPPPAALIDEAHVVGASATGDWFGRDGQLAFNTDAGWRFAAPVDGLVALDRTSGDMVIFEQAAWKPLADFITIQSLPMLGVNTGADAANRLAVRSNAALMTALQAADGGTGDMRLSINKETAAATGSLVFQTGWSGRAEFGLAGDDDFRIKVSPDGAAWAEAITINRTTGAVTLAAGSVGNDALADMATATFKGRASAGSGDPEDMTAAQAAALLPAFSITAKGLAPASGTAGAGYLRADGAWSVPSPQEGTASGPARFNAFNDCVAVVNDGNWYYTASGTGAAHTVVVFGEANAVGAIRGTLGTVATNRIAISSLSTSLFALGAGPARFAGRMRFAALSDAVNSWVLRAGFIDSIANESVDGAFFRYTDSVNGGRLQAVTRANNAETAVDTGIAAGLATTYKLEIDINADATGAVFRINGASVATITTTIPKNAGREVGYGLCAIRSLGTAAVNAYDVDYLLADVQFTTAR